MVELGDLGDQRVGDGNNRRGSESGFESQPPRVSPASDEGAVAPLSHGLRRKEDASAGHLPDVSVETWASPA